ncbi:MAG: T9SS type A sorting domain-containing protein [Bacteroidetes bacterium]|nr:T9SS type A sorting domain-containing protein [Bacteroidota bacterium]
MKKFFLLCILGTWTVLGFGQSQRFVLFEEFTNASCAPCASQNPAFDALLSANTTKCTSIKYHTNWPGVDPMNAQNPTDVAARVSYYQVSGVPYAVMDGSPATGSNYVGAPANVTQTMIDNEYAVPSTFDLSMMHSISAGNDSIFVTMLGVCTQDVTGTFLGQIGVIEKHIHFSSPPGTNGERDFYNVMKKMLPTAGGTSLPSSFQAGDYFIIQQSWKLANVYSMSELSAVGFLQNNANKKVHQAANSSTSPLTMPFDNDVELMATTNYATTNCSGSIAPIVTFRNNGNNPVTSLAIQYYVNGMTPNTFTWNGNLATLQETDIALPAISFSPESSNNLMIYAYQVNSATDQYPKNDTADITFGNAPVSHVYALLNLHTDKAPAETTWDLKDGSGSVVDAGGPYTQQNHSYTDTLHMAGIGCYTFTLYDAGGNGLCCSNGSGGYQLTTNTGSVIKQGTSFGSNEFTEINMDWATGMEQYELSDLKVFPNPVTGVANVSFNLKNAESVILNLYNSTGQLVKSVNQGSFPAGNQECSLDVHNLQSGIYMLKMQAGAQVFISKISVTK